MAAAAAAAKRTEENRRRAKPFAGCRSRIVRDPGAFHGLYKSLKSHPRFRSLPPAQRMCLVDLIERILADAEGQPEATQEQLSWDWGVARESVSRWGRQWERWQLIRRSHTRDRWGGPSTIRYTLGDELLALYDALVSSSPACDLRSPRTLRENEGNYVLTEMKDTRLPARDLPEPQRRSTPAETPTAAVLREIERIATGGGRDPSDDMPTLIGLCNRLAPEVVSEWAGTMLTLAEFAADPGRGIPRLGAYVRSQLLGEMIDAGDGDDVPAALDRFVKSKAHRLRFRCPALPPQFGGANAVASVPGSPGDSGGSRPAGRPAAPAESRQVAQPTAAPPRRSPTPTPPPPPDRSSDRPIREIPHRSAGVGETRPAASGRDAWAAQLEAMRREFQDLTTPSRGALSSGTPATHPKIPGEHR